MNSLHPRRAHGFTLIEIVIAVTITAFIGVVIGVTFSTTIANKDVIEGQAEKYRMLRAATSRMSREIGAAFVSDRYDSKRYRDAFDRPTNFVGTREKLLFTTLAHQRLYADAKESDQMVVEYYVKRSSTEQNGKGRTDLIRREKMPARRAHGARRHRRLALRGRQEDRVPVLELRERKQWEDEWDTRRSEQRKPFCPPG